MELLRRRFEDWSTTEASASRGTVHTSVRREQPPGPACLLWGRVEPHIARRWTLAEARECYRRQIEALGTNLDPQAPRTAGQVNTRFTAAVGAIEWTFRNAHLFQYLPQDNTPAFSVRQIHLSGSTQISSDKLLYGLPALYVAGPTGPKDSVDPNRVYDFRVLCEIIGSPGVERNVSQRTIEGFTRYVLARYVDASFAGVYVYVDADAVNDQGQLVKGVLPLRIIEGRVAEVSTRWFTFEGKVKEEPRRRAAYIQAASPVQEGQVIRKDDLDAYTRLLNLNPDRQVAAVVSPSGEPNSVNLTYNVYERDKDFWRFKDLDLWHFYAQVDNSGTNERQWNPRVGFLNTNLTGRDDRLSAMYQADVEAPEENYAAFGLYELPLLTPRLRLGLYAGVSEFDITPEATGGLVNFLGDGWLAGTTMRYNLIQIRDWMFDLTGSVSRETSRVDQSPGINSDVDMTLVGLGFEIHRLRETSQSSLAFERAENYGGDTEEFQDARLGADPDFVRYVFTAAHGQFLDPNGFHHLSARFRAIGSSDRLVPAKMTTFGGLYTVRGYEEDEAVADGGILASLEYRYRLFGSRPAGQTKRPLDVSLVAFTDYGRPRNQDPVLGEFHTQEMWGAGLGTIIEVNKSFLAAIYHSWALRETENPSDGRILTDEGDTQWNFNFLIRF